MSDRDPNKNLELLKQQQNDFIKLSRKACSRLEAIDPVKRATNTFRLMYFFLDKQIEHSEAVRKLWSSLEIILIVRSMLEGMSQLYYIRNSSTQSAEELSQQWINFMHIISWRLNSKRKDEVLPSVWEQNKKDIQKYGPLFFKSPKSERELSVNPDKDVYTLYWHKRRPTDLLKDMSGFLKRFLKLSDYYGIFSLYGHWQVNEIGLRLKPEITQNIVLATANLSLWYTVDTLNAYFNLELEVPMEP